MLVEGYSLDKTENSPVIVIPWFNNCRVLIDTGATVPIWVKSILPLKIKGAVAMNRKVALNGVGGKVEGDLYRVNFDFGSIHFKDLPVVHKENRQFRVRESDGIPYVYLANTYETEEEYNIKKEGKKHGCKQADAVHYMVDNYRNR